MRTINTISGKVSVECIGCSIATKNITPIGGLIAETPNFVLHQDPEIPITNFLIIASKKHIQSITQLTRQENYELFDLCYKTRKALLFFSDVIDCKVIQEEHSGHFHLWILPRYKWMNELFDKTLTSVRPIMQYARENRMTDNIIDEIISAVNKMHEIMLTQ